MVVFDEGKARGMFFRSFRPAESRHTRLPDIVTVHGLAVSGRYMLPAAELLGAHFRVYVPDLPGFGKSERPDRILGVAELARAVALWMESVGTQRAILLGNSFGCQVAAEVAVRCPDMVRGLVLVGPTVDPAHRSATEQMLRWLVDAFREPPSLWPVVTRDYLSTGARRTFLTFRKMLEHRLERLLPAIAVPAMVVRGGRDPIVPQRWGEMAARLLPRGDLAVIPGAAHAVNYDRPGELASIVRAFVASSGLQESPGRAA